MMYASVMMMSQTVCVTALQDYNIYEPYLHKNFSPIPMTLKAVNSAPYPRLGCPKLNSLFVPLETHHVPFQA